MRKAKLIILLVIPSFVWGLTGIYLVVINGYGVGDKGNGLIWSVIGAGLCLLSLPGLIFKKTRIASILSIVTIIVFGFSETAFNSYRLRLGIEQLESIYKKLADEGAPFPETIDKTSYESPDYLQWYYQKNSQESFGIVYSVSSDSYVLEYPIGQWLFVGYSPGKYKQVSTKKTNNIK